MTYSKSTKITILLAIDTIFFFLELSIGYAVHSLALVADAFHMLNDVISLCVGLWAVKVSDSKSSSKTYTYGWQRAETLGALVNGVFLVALCISIFLEAIQRFFEPQEVSQPKLILIVGCLGLASNIMGLFLFHEHGHGHSHGGHSHENDDETVRAEEGHAHSHGHAERRLESQQLPAQLQDTKVVGSQTMLPSPARYATRMNSYSASGYTGFDDIHVSPGAFRQSIIAASRMDDFESQDSTNQGQIPDNDGDATQTSASLHKPLLDDHHAGYGSTKRTSIDHQQYRHVRPKQQSKGGHSHGDLNMRGVFLHVLGDALGNVGVIGTALFIWLTNYSWRFYMDPAVSLVITAIILASAIPLCKAASRILLQAVPVGINIEDIKLDIENLPGVVSCHHVHVWQLSDTKLVGSLHIQVGFDFKSEGSARYMQLAQAVRGCLHAYGIHSSTIQPEFCLDPDHDHSSSTDVGDEHWDGVQSSSIACHSDLASRVASKAGSVCEPDTCLLECGEQCGSDKSCCTPAALAQLNEGSNATK
jgi:zinc transporter 1